MKKLDHKIIMICLSLIGLSLLIIGILFIKADDYRNDEIKKIQSPQSKVSSISKNQSSNTTESSIDIPSTSEEDVDLGEISEDMDYDSVSIPSLSEVTEANKPKNKNRAMKNVVGKISIPKINMNLNILKGTNNTNMLYGVTTMLPDQRMGEGNYVLAGHNMQSKGVLFSDLILNDIPRVHEGDKIYLEDNSGNKYTYQITSTEFVKKTDTSCLESSNEPILTLFTCAKDPHNTGKTVWRFIVHAKLIK